MAYSPFNNADPRDFAATGAKVPGKFDWASMLNVIGGGLRDLGGYSGPGHLENAIMMNAWSHDRKEAERASKAQGESERVLAASMQQPATGPGDGKAFAQAALQYLRMGGDPSRLQGFMSIANLGKPPAPMKVGKDDRLVDPATNTVLLDAVQAPRAPLAGGPGTIYRDPSDPSKILAENPNVPKLLSPEEEAQRVRIAGAGRPSTTINMPGDNAYNTKIGAGLADRDLGILDAGRTAPQRYANAQRVLDILDQGNAITGTGADWRLGVSRALATAGLVDPKDAQATENLASTLATQTLDAIKSSGLGSGQGFTDKDRQFLERAKAGQISMTPQALRDLATLNKKAAREAIKQNNEVAKRVGEGGFGAYSKSLMIDEPQDTPGGLTPAEQAELDQLRRELGNGR